MASRKARAVMAAHLVTFSDESMSRAAVLCVVSARRHGVTEDPWHWSQNGLREEVVYRDNQSLFDNARGLGYWAWKPFIVGDTLDRLRDGDVLLYADAGVEFINNVNYIIDRMDQDIFLFGNNWEHAHWCKRDVVEAAWPTFADGYYREPWEYVASSATWSRFGKQCQASVIFFRVSDYSRKFVKEWLDWCLFEGGRLIDDSPSRAPNHREFREHRHDQAILTTLAYREGINLHYWPASYNDGAFSYEKIPEYAHDDYPILFNHHRRRNHEFEEAA